MDSPHHVGVAAPGPVTPTSDEAPALAGAEGFKGQAQGMSLDCASKLIASATARAALLGIEVHALGGGAWLLRAALGSEIGVVHDQAALLTVVSRLEFETSNRELVQRMRGAA